MYLIDLAAKPLPVYLDHGAGGTKRRPAAPRIDEPKPVALLRHGTMGVAEQRGLGLGLPGGQRQPQQILLDAVAVAVGQQQPHPAQLHDARLAAAV